MLDSQRELMAAALKYLGYSVNDADEKHWKQATDLIVRAKPYWAAFSNTSYIKELAVGNLWVAHGYSNDMFQAALDAKKTGRKFTIGYSTPKEGAVLALDSMVLHRSGSRPDLAHQFINFMLDGKNSAELTNLIGSGNPNMDAMQSYQAGNREQQSHISGSRIADSAGNAAGPGSQATTAAKPFMDGNKIEIDDVMDEIQFSAEAQKTSVPGIMLLSLLPSNLFKNLSVPL